MKKSKFLILFAALVCLVTALCVTASANVYGGDCGAEGDNVTWVLNTDTGKLTISGTGAMKDYEWIGMLLFFSEIQCKDSGC